MKDRKNAVSLETIAAEWDARFQAALERRAEGARFRRTAFDLAPFEINEYLNAHSIDAYWLIGFHGDPALFDQQIEKARADQSRRMGQRGGKAPRRDRYAQQKRDILAAWEKRINRAESAIAWAERLYAQRSITVKPRTAAGWIRAAYPKKLTRKQRT